jgi:hypothetical protein
MGADRLTFVYDANGTLFGEIAYLFRSRFRGEHCSLCDITHSWHGKRSEFTSCEARLRVPITYLHRNDLGTEYASLEGRLPTVLAHIGHDWLVLMTPEQIDRCNGDVSTFELAVGAALEAIPDERR